MRTKIPNFLGSDQRPQIISFVEDLNLENNITNGHISAVANELRGESFMFDLTKTEISKYLSDYQSSGNIQSECLPSIFFEIKDRISDTLQISKDHVFLQILDQKKGGKIIPHYDTGADGYINFKCNISPLCDDYKIFVGDDVVEVTEGDLYTFEASLFKHWSGDFSNRRILLSYGFGLRYEELGRSEMDPRVRLSRRIQKYFQN